MTVIDLTKKAKIVLEKKNLNGVQAEIVFAVDISGSMSGLFSRGVVQELTERLLGIGMNMDTNKSIDVFAFNTSGHDVGSVSEGNHTNYVTNSMLRKVSVGGGTNYAPVMRKIVDKYGSSKKKGLTGLFSKKQSVPTNPTFVFFVTDGDNFDKSETEKIITESSNQAIFWQFVGIGYESFNFLQKLDDLSGRHLDNADFFSVKDLTKISDEELYDKLLTEFPSWLSQAKNKGLLV
ncbi:VWA domain-containing protein [Neobacillus vireti]|uniref:VWA domain-containing protein n=1 Tax=Neobacillus vireti TaxID=220686 RepID=UPI002FFD79F3